MGSFMKDSDFRPYDHNDLHQARLELARSQMALSEAVAAYHGAGHGTGAQAIIADIIYDLRIEQLLQAGRVEVITGIRPVVLPVGEYRDLPELSRKPNPFL